MKESGDQSGVQKAVQVQPLLERNFYDCLFFHFFTARMIMRQ